MADEELIAVPRLRRRDAKLNKDRKPIAPQDTGFLKNILDRLNNSTHGTTKPERTKKPLFPGKQEGATPKPSTSIPSFKKPEDPLDPYFDAAEEGFKEVEDIYSGDTDWFEATKRGFQEVEIMEGLEDSETYSIFAEIGQSETGVKFDYKDPGAYDVEKAFGAVNELSADKAGKNYGVLGLNSKGSLKEFVDKHGKEFGLTATDYQGKEFQNQWKKAAKDNPTKFAIAQIKFGEEKYIKPLAEEMKNHGATTELINNPGVKYWIATNGVQRYSQVKKDIEVAMKKKPKTAKEFIEAASDSAEGRMWGNFGTFFGTKGLTGQALIDQKNWHRQNPQHGFRGINNRYKANREAALRRTTDG